MFAFAFGFGHTSDGFARKTEFVVEGEAYEVFKRHFDQVQDFLQELYDNSMFSKAGTCSPVERKSVIVCIYLLDDVTFPLFFKHRIKGILCVSAGIFGKIKGDTLQLAAVLQILMLSMEEGGGAFVFSDDDMSREEHLRVSSEAMQSAVKLVHLLLEQRVVFEGDQEMQRFCSDFWDWDLPEMETETTGAGREPANPMVSIRCRVCAELFSPFYTWLVRSLADVFIPPVASAETTYVFPAG